MASRSVAQNRSVNLKDTEKEDNFGNEDEDNEEENELKNLREEVRLSTVWRTGGDVKNEVLWKLEKLFSSLVAKYDDDNSNRVIYETLLSAHKSVSRVTKLLSDSDNTTTRDFTIHIANKKWVRTTLVPLMELGIEDRDLTMRCCRLLMVLTRNLNLDAKSSSTLAVKKTKGKETKEESSERFIRESEAKSNAQQQISAFLSFKEAVCTEKCCVAVTNAFYHLWRAEKEERREREEKRITGPSNEFTKREVATCFSYIRRLLQVDAVPCHSSPGEVIMAKNVHNKLVVHLRAALQVVPVICAELADKYNDVWLTDIIRIIHYVLRGHESKDFFKVWKANCLIGQDLDNEYENNIISIDDTITKTQNNHTTQNNQNTQNTQNNNQNKNKSSIGNKTLGTGGANFAVPTTLAQRAPSVASRGVLGSILGRERIERAKKMEVMGRHGRFGGQFRVAITQTTQDPTEDTPTPSLQGVAKMISRPFTQSQIPQAKAKNNRKKITFSNVDPYEAVALNESLEGEGQRACVVAATMAERLCTGMGLTQLVQRVGDDRLREGGLISTDMELMYFEVISSLMHFNRLKLDYEKSVYEDNTENKTLGLNNYFAAEMNNEKENITQNNAQNKSTGTSNGGNGGKEKKGWVPYLQNVLHAMDTMSFRRVFDSFEKLLSATVKRYNDMISPLRTYKEMICYLRVLLESADETHNEFAIARLYSIFYTNSERKDPLPRLLAEWLPGTYGRKHLNVLVELVHETMKTLDVAASKYGHVQKEKTSRKDKKAADWEQYIAGCLNFDPNEYFKRYLATNGTVRMYTILLSYHSSNDVSTNHYAYCYLQRMCSFQLVQDFPLPNRESRVPTLTAGNLSALGGNGVNGLGGGASGAVTATGNVSPSSDDVLTLGHMLFNVTTLTIFRDVLADSYATKQKTLEPLIRLLKSVTRRYGKAYYKNHQLSSEAIFQHPHVHNFVVELDNIFEAPLYARSYNTGLASMRPKEIRYSDNDEDSSSERENEGERRDKDTTVKVTSKDHRMEGRDGRDGKDGKGENLKKSNRGEEEEEDEFNEDDYAGQERITKKSIEMEKKKAALKRRQESKKSKKSAKDSDESDKSDKESDDSDDDAKKSVKKTKQTRNREQKKEVVDSDSNSASSDSDDSDKSDDSDSDDSDNGDNGNGGGKGKGGDGVRLSDSENEDGGEKSKGKSNGNNDDDEDLFNNTGKKSNSKVKKNKELRRKERKEKEARESRIERDNKKEKESRKTGAKWTAAEDVILREQFDLFRGTRSVFEMIASDADLRAIGNNRNVAAVSRRVRELDLTQKDFSDDEEENNEENKDKKDKDGDNNEGDKMSEGKSSSEKAPFSFEDEHSEDENGNKLVNKGENVGEEGGEKEKGVMSMDDRLKAYWESDLEDKENEGKEEKGGKGGRGEKRGREGRGEKRGRDGKVKERGSDRHSSKSLKRKAEKEAESDSDNYMNDDVDATQAQSQRSSSNGGNNNRGKLQRKSPVISDEEEEDMFAKGPGSGINGPGSGINSSGSAETAVGEEEDEGAKNNMRSRTIVDSDEE